ncbi:ABC transporter permease [Psychromonas algicola]|uniref:ABC transporter permease n=1 Tax=Psychromonas algicola TaxID=2555642 RepID=UPI001068D165|nr:ABC transporter permease [Psychromonas sp. RZ5]TEW50688.1 ABC transporter permease [Psychromonas sp. RZ5]
MAILSLAFKSLLNRKLTFFITLFSIAISVTLLLGVQTLKTETKTSFMKSISGTDLIIGSRGASSQLLLSSVFHIGSSTNTIKYETYQDIEKLPAVEWAVPISMGDSHKGYTVIATNLSFFDHFSYANKQNLTVQSGSIDDDMFAVAIGADVAQKLDYHVGDRIIVTHGGGEIEGHDHDNIPFFVSAILSPSFTAIDQTLIISLEAMEAMHTETHDHLGALPGETLLDSDHHEHHDEHDEDHEQHAAHDKHDEHHDEHDEDHEQHTAHDKHDEHHDEHDEDHAQHAAHDKHDEHDEDHEQHAAHDKHDEHHDEHDESHEQHAAHEHEDTQDQRIARLLKLKPENINAIFVGLTSRHAVLGMQSYVNNFQGEPLTAIIPAVALQELWQFFSLAESALNIVTTFVVLVGLLGMLSIILMSLNERRREMAVLRSVGARPSHIFGLIIGEAGFVCLTGILLGVILLYAVLLILQTPLANYYGFYLDINMLTSNDLFILLTIQCSALLIALIPGALIYKYSLSDGMNIKF